MQFGFCTYLWGKDWDIPTIIANCTKAKAFGVEGHRVASPAALERVLGKVIHAEKPVLIEIEVPQGNEVSPWEFIHPGNPQAHLKRGE